MPFLTKSKYISGMQCSKLLWTMLNDPDKIPPISPETQFVFALGHEVGDFAKKLYPNGIDIPYKGSDAGIAQTKKLLAQRKPLFEASVGAGDLYARIDILNPVKGDQWDIIEVKSATKVKDVNLLDVAFQKYCCDQSGLAIRHCYLMHIDNTYVRKGEIDPAELCTIEDISTQIDDMIGDVPGNVEELMKAVKLKECPDIAIGPHCLAPYECSLKGHCWSHVPERSVFNLYKFATKKKFELLERSIKTIEEIPESIELSDKQMIQKTCVENKSAYVDRGEIKAFLKELKYPLYYLDFETFSPAIPLYDGMRPYQRLPFQYSLHVVKSEGGAVEHYSYLSDGQGDPRETFAQSLHGAIGTKGSVVAYHAGFEKGVLDEIAAAFPKETGWIDNVLSRVVDLIIPFSSFHYYHPDQNGSASLKRVLPALTGKGYEGMNISDGNEASRIFSEKVFNCKPQGDTKKILQDLEDYCKLDTQAMIDIVHRLKEESQ